MGTAADLVKAAARLRDGCGELRFGPPVTTVYNPLVYAWEPHRRYLQRWGAGRKQVIFVGMNPGPWGMAQTGVPFGEVGYVRDWLRVTGRVAAPDVPHAKRPVTGFACRRSEVSGKRLWGLFSERFGQPDRFFHDHLVVNYCPLLFYREDGGNVTPDKLSRADRDPLYWLCDAHLRAVVEALGATWVIGVGAFAATRARESFAAAPVRVISIPHPSPANPTANRGWAAQVERQLRDVGIWP